MPLLYDEFLPGGNVVPRVGNPALPNTPVVEPTAPEPAADPIGEWVRTLLPPQKSQRVSSKIVGARAGTADLTGVGDLLANLSFQRLWDSYNPGKSADFRKTFEAPNAITAAQGDPGGHIWGYIDPTWLPGFDPGVRKTTIEEILTPMYRNVWRELPAAEKLVDPVIPPPLIYDQPHRNKERNKPLAM